MRAITTGWIEQVHEWAIAAGAGVSATQIEELFGNPPGKQCAAEAMRTAHRRGLFTVREVDGLPGRRRLLYTAVRPGDPTLPRALLGRPPGAGGAASWFDGLPRLASVWELGRAAQEGGADA